MEEQYTTTKKVKVYPRCTICSRIKRKCFHHKCGTEPGYEELLFWQVFGDKNLRDRLFSFTSGMKWHKWKFWRNGRLAIELGYWDMIMRKSIYISLKSSVEEWQDVSDGEASDILTYQRQVMEYIPNKFPVIYKDTPHKLDEAKKIADLSHELDVTKKIVEYCMESAYLMDFCYNTAAVYALDKGILTEDMRIFHYFVEKGIYNIHELVAACINKNHVGALKYVLSFGLDRECHYKGWGLEPIRSSKLRGIDSPEYTSKRIKEYVDKSWNVRNSPTLRSRYDSEIARSLSSSDDDNDDNDDDLESHGDKFERIEDDIKYGYMNPNNYIDTIQLEHISDRGTRKRNCRFGSNEDNTDMVETLWFLTESQLSPRPEETYENFQERADCLLSLELNAKDEWRRDREYIERAVLKCGAREIVDLLKEHGVDVAKCPLKCIVGYKKSQWLALEALESRTNVTHDELLEAVSSGSLKFLTKVYETNKGSCGITHLISAIKCNYPKTINFLLRKGILPGVDIIDAAISSDIEDDVLVAIVNASTELKTAVTNAKRHMGEYVRLTDSILDKALCNNRKPLVWLIVEAVPKTLNIEKILYATKHSVECAVILFEYYARKARGTPETIHFIMKKIIRAVIDSGDIKLFDRFAKAAGSSVRTFGVVNPTHIMISATHSNEVELVEKTIKLLFENGQIEFTEDYLRLFAFNRACLSHKYKIAEHYANLVTDVSDNLWIYLSHLIKTGREREAFDMMERVKQYRFTGLLPVICSTCSYELFETYMLTTNITHATEERELWGDCLKQGSVDLTSCILQDVDLVRCEKKLCFLFNLFVDKMSINPTKMLTSFDLSRKDRNDYIRMILRHLSDKLSKQTIYECLQRDFDLAYFVLHATKHRLTRKTLMNMIKFQTNNCDYRTILEIRAIDKERVLNYSRGYDH